MKKILFLLTGLFLSISSPTAKAGDFGDNFRSAAGAVVGVGVGVAIVRGVDVLTGGSSTYYYHPNTVYVRQRPDTPVVVYARPYYDDDRGRHHGHHGHGGGGRHRW